MTILSRRACVLGSLGLGFGATLPVPVSALTRPQGASMRGAPAPAKIEVLAHRGACALRPEHTLASYAKAIADGADFIEPDLQPSKDGVLMALHENELSRTTDVAAHPEFASRRRTVTVGGHTLDGWFIVDFTYAELKTLRLKERIPDIRPDNARYDGEFQMVSLDELIDFVAAEAATRGRPIGLVPELKTPYLFTSLGLAVEDTFLETLSRHSYVAQAPMIVQCFEAPTLRRLRERMGRRDGLRFMQLVGGEREQPFDVVLAGGTQTYGDMLTDAGLRDMATYADILSPDIRALIPLGADGRLGRPDPVIGRAKAAGLQVFAWEFAPENRFMAADFRDGRGENARNVDGSVAEIHHYLAAGLDGFFTDDPGVGRRAVDTFRRRG
ncbi:glycerophosphodiester phosphodiesterase family protein [Nitrospirillum sp. BR 11828]|uniref:glycerophosphodiester phosphodiesterase family protein n=1 Tax=Nitrospirillum sp. BR 11828 TaxID=3104325 RepID=UPI002ACA417D|nr:glycerophosphodiester phosphodiesterase family protein [Nitrospirillum sp. BR 11828]MDZ5646330.1 glycerophosphodiester phosphodiesterase family protein [Nitrospirillum sp. BR 11828]